MVAPEDDVRRQHCAAQRQPSDDGGADDKRRAFLQPRQAVGAVRNPVFRRLGIKSATCGAQQARPTIATPEAVAGCLATDCDATALNGSTPTPRQALTTTAPGSASVSEPSEFSKFSEFAPRYTTHRTIRKPQGGVPDHNRALTKLCPDRQ